jgi:hypothetical protein
MDDLTQVDEARGSSTCDHGALSLFPKQIIDCGGIHFASE